MNKAKTVSLNGINIDINEKVVMTIINITTDSFYENSRSHDEKEILRMVEAAIDQGATIIDIGAYSSRPGADNIPLEEEIQRQMNAVRTIRTHFGEFPISLDTFRSEVVKEVVDSFGQVMVNDISAGEMDPLMYKVVAENKLPYIAMHMRGTPANMNTFTMYNDVVKEVIEYFRDKIELLRGHGIENIIIDPGFGFAKTTAQNFQILKRLNEFKQLDTPILAGISRKSMIYKTLDITPKDALCGTIALNWEALRGGANILRVHDTLEAAQTIKLFKTCFE